MLNAITAALSLIQTEFSKFKDKVQDITGEENITAALVEKEFGKLDQLKDLDEAWGQVYTPRFCYNDKSFNRKNR